MLNRAIMLAGALVVLGLVAPAGATTIGFETAEGYETGDLAGQPGTPPGGTQWSLRQGAGGVLTVAGGGVGDGSTAALRIDVDGDNDHYIFQTGAPEIGAFDPDSSVVNYSWKFKRDDPGATGDNRRMVFWVGSWGSVTSVEIRSGNDNILYAGGTVGGIAGWNQIDVTARWRPAAETETYDISINGVDKGTFDFTYQHHSGGGYAPPTFWLISKDVGDPGQLGYVDDVTIVPEPATMGLLVIGGVLAMLRRRKR